MKLYNAHNKPGFQELWLGKPQLSGSVSLNLTPMFLCRASPPRGLQRHAV